jgi:four helix bundle protein
MVLRANAGRLLVHQIAAGIATEAASLASGFRGPGALARGDQLVRAALSVTSNISEACGRGTIGEFRQFLRYARGSAHELRSQLQIARLLEDPPRASRCKTLESRATLVIKLLGRLHDNPPPDR